MRADVQEQFDNFDSFLAAVVQYGASNGMAHDRRLVWASASGANESFPSEGGFLVPSDFAIELWERAYNTGILLSLCDRQPITRGNVLKIPTIDERNRATGSRLGGLRTYWANEADTASVTKPTWRSVDLHLNKLFGLHYATGELFEDVPAYTAVLQRAFALEASFVVEDGIIGGLGAGQMLGVLNSDALLTITPESGQAAATIRAENVIKAFSRIWAPSQRRMVWLYNQEAVEQIFALVGTNGVPLISYADDGPRLLGRPLIAHESCRAVGDVGDLIAVDPSQYLIGEKPPSFAESLALRFLQHEGVFRFVWRVAGSPAWSSAVTPLYGSNTVSPYVVIGARN
jgi:HK97 family phage major capsid protein